MCPVAAESCGERLRKAKIEIKKGAGLVSYTYHYAYRVQTENKQKDV